MDMRFYIASIKDTIIKVFELAFPVISDADKYLPLPSESRRQLISRPPECARRVTKNLCLRLYLHYHLLLDFVYLHHHFVTSTSVKRLVQSTLSSTKPKQPQKKPKDSPFIPHLYLLALRCRTLFDDDKNNDLSYKKNNFASQNAHTSRNPKWVFCSWIGGTGSRHLLHHATFHEVRTSRPAGPPGPAGGPTGPQG